jgi:hypothetical protein
LLKETRPSTAGTLSRRNSSHRSRR